MMGGAGGRGEGLGDRGVLFEMKWFIVCLKLKTEGGRWGHQVVQNKSYILSANAVLAGLSVEWCFRSSHILH